MAAVSPYQPSALALTNTTSIINNVDTDSRTPLLRLVFAQVIYKLYIDSQKAQDLADGDKKALIRPFDLVEFWALSPDSSKGRIVSEGVAVIMQGFPIIQAANDATAALLADETNSDNNNNASGGGSLESNGVVTPGTATDVKRGAAAATVSSDHMGSRMDKPIRVTVDICTQLWKDVLNIDEMSTAANPELSTSSHARFKAVLALLYKSYRDSVINEIRVYEHEYTTRLDEITSIETGTLNKQLMHEMQQIDDDHTTVTPVKQEDTAKRSISELASEDDGMNKRFKSSENQLPVETPRSGSDVSSGLSELDEREIEAMDKVESEEKVKNDNEAEVVESETMESRVPDIVNKVVSEHFRPVENTESTVEKVMSTPELLVGGSAGVKSEEIKKEQEEIKHTDVEEEEEEAEEEKPVVKEKPMPIQRGRRGRYPRHLHKEDILINEGKASSVSRDNSPDGTASLTSAAVTPTPSNSAAVKPNKRFQNMANPLLANISSNRSASFFTSPVNPNDAPNYYTLIHSPTDLRTIKAMIKDGRLQDSSSLELELCKMFANAIMYNSWDSDVCEWSRQMASETESLLGIFKSAERRS